MADQILILKGDSATVNRLNSELKNLGMIPYTLESERSYSGAGRDDSLFSFGRRASNSSTVAFLDSENKFNILIDTLQYYDDFRFSRDKSGAITVVCTNKHGQADKAIKALRESLNPNNRYSKGRKGFLYML